MKGSINGGKNRSYAHSAHTAKKKDLENINPHSRSVLWAVLTLIVSTILLFGVGEGANNGGVAYVVAGLVMVLACYSIVKQNPASAWYVPLFVNLLGIIAAFIEPTFWKTNLWEYNSAIWLLCVLAAIMGAMTHKPAAVSRKSQVVKTAS